MSCLKGNLQEHVRDGGVETFHIKLDEGQLLLLLQVVEPVSRLSGPPPLPQLGLPPKLRVDPLQHLLRHLSQLGFGGVEEATLWVALEFHFLSSYFPAADHFFQHNFVFWDGYVFETVPQ